MRVTHIAGWSLVGLLCAVPLGAAGAASSLVQAVKDGDSAAVRAILNQPNVVNTPEADGTTALHWAADRDDLPTVDLLIRAGANVKAANRYGATPLYSAAVN